MKNKDALIEAIGRVCDGAPVWYDSNAPVDAVFPITYLEDAPKALVMFCGFHYAAVIRWSEVDRIDASDYSASIFMKGGRVFYIVDARFENGVDEAYVKTEVERFNNDESRKLYAHEVSWMELS